jgi:hypothetical protein
VDFRLFLTSKQNWRKPMAVCNREKMHQAIAIMQRAGKVEMSIFQDGRTHATTEEEIHKCGNKACFAGWVAVSPEFLKDGGRVSRPGSPIFKSSYGSDAISSWLSISEDLAECLVCGECDSLFWAEEDYPSFYAPVPFHKVQAVDVIRKLSEILVLDYLLDTFGVG